MDTKALEERFAGFQTGIATAVELSMEGDSRKCEEAIEMLLSIKNSIENASSEILTALKEQLLICSLVGTSTDL